MNRDEPKVLQFPDVRQTLLRRLAESRAITDDLFDRLEPGCLYERPIAERHRVVFYLGHLEAFDWNLLSGSLGRHASHPAIDAGFNRLFAFGIDPLDTGLPQDKAADWPALPAILAYRRDVRQALDDLIDAVPMACESPWVPAPNQGFDAACLLNVAIEHRLMHAETLAYMLHRLPVGSLCADQSETPLPVLDAPAALAPKMLTIPAGRVVLGTSQDDALAFGWDNEFGAHEVHVPAFDIDQHMVTNGQYLAFMADGGYERAELWTPDDWAWRTRQCIQHPGFWQGNAEQGWRLRAMHQELPLPMDWPVYVSHAEASAYARWAGKVLPSEAQWMRAASGTPALTAASCNANFRRWDPEPVQAASHFSEFGVAGLFGNGWEWTASPFEPLPGFTAFPFYPGYSKDFFDGRHFVLKGGSPRTAACMLRPAFRNWFQAHYQHAYAGFRCAKNH
ncbi:MAG: ergothioneine biosynthesis protein EgtB [Rubrivivax sp.]|nr:MAG: ergothioneine biosynthesis protein EgtB [Rubrivivax sp.]